MFFLLHSTDKKHKIKPYNQLVCLICCLVKYPGSVILWNKINEQRDNSSCIWRRSAGRMSKQILSKEDSLCTVTQQPVNTVLARSIFAAFRQNCRNCYRKFASVTNIPIWIVIAIVRASIFSFDTHTQRATWLRYNSGYNCVTIRRNLAWKSAR